MVDNDMKDNKMNKKEKIINYALNILIGLFSIVLVVSVYNTIQIRIFKKKLVEDQLPLISLDILYLKFKQTVWQSI